MFLEDYRIILYPRDAFEQMVSKKFQYPEGLFHKPIRDSFHIKKMALLLVGAASLPELFDAILTEYNLCLKFFNIEDAGKVLVRGVKDKGDINNIDALNEAYRLGCSI